MSSADTLSAGEDVLDEPARPDAAQVDPRHQGDRGERRDRLAREGQRHERQRDDEERRRIVRRRDEPADDRTPGPRRWRRSRRRSRRRTTSSRSGTRRGGRTPPAGRRTRRRRAAAAPPARHTPSRRRTRAVPPATQVPRNSQRVRHGRGDLRRREQDAAADHVGHDDRGRVERTEPALQSLRLGGRLSDGSGNGVRHVDCGATWKSARGEYRSSQGRPTSSNFPWRRPGRGRPGTTGAPSFRRATAARRR